MLAVQRLLLLQRHWVGRVLLAELPGLHRNAPAALGSNQCPGTSRKQH